MFQETQAQNFRGAEAVTTPKRTPEEIAKAVCGTINGPAGCPGGYGDGPCPDCSEILAALREAADAGREEGRAGAIRGYHVTLDSLGAPADEWPCNRAKKLADAARQEERGALRLQMQQWKIVTRTEVLRWLDARAEEMRR